MSERTNSRKARAMRKHIIGLAMAVMMLAAGTAHAADDHRLAYDGYEKMRAGDLAAAERYFKRALRRNPNNGNALLNLGVVYHKTERSEAACKLFEKILALDSRGIISISADSRNLGSSLAQMARNNLALLGKL